MNHQDDTDEDLSKPLASADVRILKPTGVSTGDLVNRDERFIVSQVYALIDGLPANGVFGRVYGPGQSFPPVTPSNPAGFDPLASSYLKMLNTQDRQWCHAHLNFSPASEVPTICSDTSPFPENKLKVWAVRSSQMYPASLPLFFGLCGTPTPCVAQTAGVGVAHTTCDDEGPDEQDPCGCGASKSGPTESDDTSSQFIAPGTPELRYRNLTVNDLFFGNQLLLPNGDPLRASRIEIHARAVRWNSDCHKIRSSLGNNNRIADAQWRFPGTFENSIVVNQPGIRFQMLLSESRRHPQTMDLDASQDIILQVNDLLAGYGDNTGTFDVVVKVLS